MTMTEDRCLIREILVRFLPTVRVAIFVFRIFEYTIL